METTSTLTGLPLESEERKPVRGTAGALTLAQHEIESTVVGFFDQFQTRVLHYVLTCGLSFHDAEDVMQETFLSLFHHLTLGRSRANLRGWLFRVTRAFDAEEVLARQPAAGHNPEVDFAFNQLHRQLRAVFAALPEQERRCLHLRAEGLTYREIAEVLQISLGAVSLSLSRALARMTRATGGE
jgi:RNA polymerase sigma-70 factor (ECF subfamily)